MGPLRILFGIALAVARASGQPAAFEVATIKPAKPSPGTMMNWRDPAGHFVAENHTLERLIESAYKVQENQVAGGPAWIRQTTFDVVAKPPGPSAMDQERVMLQGLLAERFGLRFHRETRQMPIYALVVGRGAKLREAPAGDRLGGSSSGKDFFQAHGLGISALAEFLTSMLRRTVRDETELPGVYNFRVNFSPSDPQATSDHPSIFTALQEQLGLKLEPRRGPVEVLVIDEAEQPSEN